MIRIVTVEDMKRLIGQVTLKTFFLQLIDQLKSDYSRWEEFQKSARHATYSSQGVIELMPISDNEYYAFKYVNGHPGNAKQKKQGRESGTEITLFDSVGFALEDYSALRLVHRLAEEYRIGHQLDLIPEISDPKNLFGVIA